MGEPVKEIQNLYQYDWDFTPKQEEITQNKVDYIKQIIPADVKTIIDIGCGSGFITNQLADDYKVTGVDTNTINLKKVRCKTVHAQAHTVNLPSKSFDLVFSSELLEHLPDEKILLQTVNTFKKLTKKYILITVPNNEKLQNGYVKCGKCGHVFHSSFHNFSFDRKALENLFQEYETIHFDTIGPIRRYNENDFLLYIRNNIANRWAKPNRNSFCPQCKNKNDFVKRKNLFAKILSEIVSFLARFVAIRKRNWIILLLKKKSGV